MTWKDAAWFPVIGSVREQWTLDSRGATQHPTDASTALHLHAKRTPHCRMSPFASRFTTHALVRGPFLQLPHAACTGDPLAPQDGTRDYSLHPSLPCTSLPTTCVCMCCLRCIGVQVVLGSLFLAIKFLGAYYVNLVMNFYFFFVGVLAVGACMSPFLAPALTSVGCLRPRCLCCMLTARHASPWTFLPLSGPTARGGGVVCRVRHVCKVNVTCLSQNS